MNRPQSQTQDTWVSRVVSTTIPTEHGQFELCLYENNIDDKEHLAVLDRKSVV